MSSGVVPDEGCLTTFQDLKLGKKHKYVIYHINKARTHVEVEKTSTDDSYDAFLEELPEDSPRFIVYDFEFEKENAGKRNKILFISWSPDTAKIKEKMLYASSKEALRRSLQGVAVEIQATDLDEVSHESVLSKVDKGA